VHITQTRDDHGAGVNTKVCAGANQHFLILMGLLNFCNDACQTMELIETCFLTSVVIYHESVTLCGSTEYFTTYDGFRS